MSRLRQSRTSYPKLITSIFAVDIIPLVFNTWMNRIEKDYESKNFNQKFLSIVKTLDIPFSVTFFNHIFNKTKVQVVTLGSLLTIVVYLYYLRAGKSRSHLKVPMRSVGDEIMAIRELEDFVVTNYRHDWYFHKAGKILQGNQLGNLLDISPVNSVIVELIETEVIIPSATENGWVWTIGETICQQIPLFSKYLPRWG